MRLEPPARAQFIGQYLGPLFAQRGIGTIILDWDHNWDDYQSPLQVLADTAAPRYIAGVAWHCYGGGGSAPTPVRDAHPDKETYFTPGCADRESTHLNPSHPPHPYALFFLKKKKKRQDL